MDQCKGPFTLSAPAEPAYLSPGPVKPFTQTAVGLGALPCELRRAERIKNLNGPTDETRRLCCCPAAPEALRSHKLLSLSLSLLFLHQLRGGGSFPAAMTQIRVSPGSFRSPPTDQQTRGPEPANQNIRCGSGDHHLRETVGRSHGQASVRL